VLPAYRETLSVLFFHSSFQFGVQRFGVALSVCTQDKTKMSLVQT
jgi:hypothetical protein